MKQQETGQKIAVTVWDHRVSPVFDSARTLLIAEFHGETLINTSYLRFDPDRPLELLQMLQAQKIMVIICGAVSEGPANMLEAAGFELIPFIAGDVRRVLQSYIQGDLLGTEFNMPGCGKRLCCRGKIRRGREIGTLNPNGRQGRGQQRPPPAPVTHPCENQKDSAAVAEMPVRLSGKP